MHALEKDETKSGSISWMKCCVLNPAHAHPVHTWCNKTKKQQPQDIKAQRLWKRWPVISFLSSQLSHSAPEFDQYVEPDADKAPRNEHERPSKHPGTGTLTYTHTHTFSLLCVSLPQPFIAFVKKAQNTKTNNAHTHSGGPPPTRSKSPIHLNNGEEESAGARLSVAPPPTLHFWRCQPIRLSDKTREGATFKAVEEEKVMFE